MDINLQTIKGNIPDYVNKVADILNKNKYKAYLVGGAVRDLVMGRVPKDYDIATDALPERMAEIFERCITTNARFGTVLVIIEANDTERFDVEVTTFRKEAEYYGGRWPGKVDFSMDILTDLSRRDFTFDAMAIDLTLIKSNNNIDEIILDPYHGLDDIKSKVIRAVGNPNERFSEDGLRAFRACRMSSEFNFKIDEATFTAIKQTVEIASQISMERIRDEFVKCVKHSPKPSVGIELMRVSGLLGLFIPELLDNIGVTQPEFHDDDVYQHSLKVMDLAEDSVKLAALFHDLGKKDTEIIGKDNKTHFYGHDIKGAEIARQIMQRMKFSNNEINRVTSLIRWHMFYYPSAEWRKVNTLDDLGNNDNNIEGGWSDAAIRRFISKVGEDLIDDLFRLRIADATANPRSEFDPKEISALEKRISEIRNQDMAIKIKDLKIDGGDLINLGIAPGPQLGLILKGLLDLIIEDPKKNNRTTLLQIVRGRYLK